MVKLTHEEYMNKIKEKNIGNYELLEEYKGYKFNHKILHVDCGTEFEMTGRGFLDYSKRCPKCENGLKYNNKTFMEEANKRKSTEGYKLIDNFKSTKKHHKFYHEECGKYFTMKGSEFLYNMNRCPNCCFSVKYSNEEFLEKAKKEKNISGYSILGKYNGFSKITKFKHDDCGTEFEMTGGSFLNNVIICPNCDKIKLLKYNKKSFNEKMKENRKDYDDYELLDDKFKGIQTKHNFLHKKCNRSFNMLANNMLNNDYECPHCSLENRFLTKKEFLEICNKKFNSNEYLILDNEFKGTKNIYNFHHKKCGNNFKMKAEYFKDSINKCPFCAKQYANSLAHRQIEKYLIDTNTNVEFEKTFEDLKINQNLRFDFYLVDYNVLIEYDGEQHFRKNPSSRFPKEKLEEIRMKDKMKDEYCINKNITLYRINYKQDHLKEIENIIKELQRLNK